MVLNLRNKDFIQESDGSVFTVDNLLLLRQLCLYLLVGIVGGAIVIWLFASIWDEFATTKTKSDIIFAFFLGIPATIYFLYLTIFLLAAVLLGFHRFYMKIEVSDDSITICRKNRHILIKKEMLLHVIDSGGEILVVFNSFRGILTLRLERAIFGRDDFKRLSERLRVFDFYTDDIDAKTKLYRDYKIDCIFRTNHLELKMDSLLLDR